MNEEYKLYSCYLDAEPKELLSFVEKQLIKSKDFVKEIRRYLFEIEKTRSLTDEEKAFCEQAIELHHKGVDAALMVQAMMEKSVDRSQGVFGVDDKLQAIFGIDEAKAIRKELPNATITEVYDNSVDIMIHTEYGNYVFGVFCYYADGDTKRPLAGVVDYDADGLYCEFSNDTFSKEERNHLQALLDSHAFEEGHFSYK